MDYFNTLTPLTDISANSFVRASNIADYLNHFSTDSAIGKNYGADFAEWFLDAANQNGINIVYFLNHAIGETGWFSSYDARVKNNFWGFEAFDSNPDLARHFDNPKDGIYFIAQFMKENYLTPGGFAYQRAIAQKKTPATLQGIAGIWWTSGTFANTVLALMNQFVDFINAIPQPAQVEVQTPQVSVETQQKTYTVQSGGWRWNVIQEIINAKIWSGVVPDHQAEFDRLNPITPQGGFKHGDVVVIGEAPIEATPVVQPAPVPEVDYVEKTIEFGQSLGFIFEDLYKKPMPWGSQVLTNWYAWIKANNAVPVRFPDEIPSGVTWKFPKSV